MSPQFYLQLWYLFLELAIPVPDCRNFWCRHTVHWYWNMEVWQMVCVGATCALHQYCAQTYLFENLLNSLKCSSLMKIRIGMANAKPLIFLKQTSTCSVDKKNQLDVTFCILYFSSNSCSTCFGQPCAHHQELTTAWCYSLVLVCAVAAGRLSSPVGR